MIEQYSKYFKLLCLSIFAGLALLSFLPTNAQAQTAGETRYNPSRIQFGDGVNWRNTYNTYKGETGCTTGDTRYYGLYKVMQHCVSNQWRDMAIRLNNYTCTSGSWGAAGTGCSEKTPLVPNCTSGTVSSGSSVCCESTPSSTCSGGIPTYDLYRCNGPYGAGAWGITGSCGTLDQYGKCYDYGGTSVDGDWSCCDSWPLSCCEDGLCVL